MFLRRRLIKVLNIPGCPHRLTRKVVRGRDEEERENRMGTG
jgi:hypothetical protein